MLSGSFLVDQFDLWMTRAEREALRWIKLCSLELVFADEEETVVDRRHVCDLKTLI